MKKSVIIYLQHTVWVSSGSDLSEIAILVANLNKFGNFLGQMGSPSKF
jgi:hypothetical protein